MVPNGKGRGFGEMVEIYPSRDVLPCRYRDGQFLKMWSLCLTFTPSPQYLIWPKIRPATNTQFLPFFNWLFVARAVCCPCFLLFAPGLSVFLLILTPPCIYVLFNPGPAHKVVSQDPHLWGVIIPSLSLRSATSTHCFSFLFYPLVPIHM